MKTQKRMNSILERFKRRQVKQPEASQPAIVEKFSPKRERTIPPHIVACKVCEGKGVKDGEACPPVQRFGARHRVVRGNNVCVGLRAGRRHIITEPWAAL